MAKIARKKSFEILRRITSQTNETISSSPKKFERSLRDTINLIRTLGDALDGQPDILLRPYLKDLYLLAKQLTDYQESQNGAYYSELINALAVNDGFDPNHL